jgi:hypothetical protein
MDEIDFLDGRIESLSVHKKPYLGFWRRIMDAHPNPSDIVGSLEWIMDRLAFLFDAQGTQRLNASQACAELGYPRGYLHSRPWRIPGFGANGLPPTRRDWETWLARPEIERRAEWDAMPVAQRRKIRGMPMGTE